MRNREGPPPPRVPFPGGFLGEAMCNENGPLFTSLILYFRDNHSGIVGFGPFETLGGGLFVASPGIISPTPMGR